VELSHLYLMFFVDSICVEIDALPVDTLGQIHRHVTCVSCDTHMQPTHVTCDMQPTCGVTCDTHAA
jgi:hypothetical protein